MLARHGAVAAAHPQEPPRSWPSLRGDDFEELTLLLIFFLTCTPPAHSARMNTQHGDALGFPHKLPSEGQRSAPRHPRAPSASMGEEPRGHRAPPAPDPPTPRTPGGCPTGTPGSSALPPETTGLRPREEGGGRDGRAPASSPSSPSSFSSSSQRRRSARCPRAAPPGSPRLPRRGAGAARAAGAGGSRRGWAGAASHLTLSAAAAAILPPLPRPRALRPLPPGPARYRTSRGAAAAYLSPAMVALSFLRLCRCVVRHRQQQVEKSHWRARRWEGGVLCPFQDRWPVRRGGAPSPSR